MALNSTSSNAILIVDDEEQVRLILKRYLEDEGYFCRTAENGQAALNLLEQDHFAVMILDIMMPGISGTEVLVNALKRDPDLAIVIVTAVDDTLSAYRAFELGAFGYIVKPFHRNEILINTSNALQRRKLAIDNRNYKARLEKIMEDRTTELEETNSLLEKEIEKREEAQEQVQKDHTFLSNIIESLPFPFYVIDARDYSVLMANSMACAVEGGSGGKCYALTHGRTSPCTGGDHLCPLQELKRTGKPVKTEHIHTDSIGNIEFVEVHGYPIFDEKGDILQMIEFSLNITPRKELEGQLRQASITDPLTGLHNRRGFMTLAAKQLEVSKRLENTAYLLFADVDGMKNINDTFGHEAGDQALKAAASLLRETLRGADVIGRMGGDEFAAFLFESSASDHSETVISRLEVNLSRFNGARTHPFLLSISCGVVPIDKTKKQSLDDLISRADALMYEQKRDKKKAGLNVITPQKKSL